MPEGPSIVILKEAAKPFEGRTIERVEGNTRLDKDRLVGRRIVAVRSWGKHFLLELDGLALRVHFLLFGTYRINERKDMPARLSLGFSGGDELNFYTSSLQFIEAPLDSVYDWHADVMSDQWDPALARKRLRARPDLLACDALLDQDVFAGVGNIIKNEVLFRIRVHPLSTMGALPAPVLRSLVEQARQYAFEFLEWKKQFVLKQHWQAHRQTTCPRCQIPLHHAKLGKTNRRSDFCERCQVRYGDAGAAVVPVNVPEKKRAAQPVAAARKRAPVKATASRSAARKKIASNPQSSAPSPEAPPASRSRKRAA